MRYQIRHAIVKYAADTILKDVNFEIHDHEKIAIIGRNGCGKTTLLKLISGEVEMANPDSDEECGIVMAGKQRIGYLRQISFEDSSITVEEEILKVFAPVFSCEKRMQELTEQMKTDTSEHLLKEYATLQAKMEALRGYTYRQDMETMFQRFGFALKDLQRPIGTFSGGQQTKVAFVKLLLSQPDIMLLDEPTNHLDMPTIEWLEGYLKKFRGAIFMVTHDRYFLDRVTNVILELTDGKLYRHEGNYEVYLENRAAREEMAFATERKRRTLYRRELEWMRRGAQARTTKAKGRIERFHQLEDSKLVVNNTSLEMKSVSSRLGKKIIELAHVSKAFDGVPVIMDFSYNVLRDDRIGIIGENGSGKSTLLKLLTGELTPDSGSVEIGETVKIGYFSQENEHMDKSLRVIEYICSIAHNVKTEDGYASASQMLERFLFPPHMHSIPVERLSGGEQRRLFSWERRTCCCWTNRRTIWILTPYVFWRTIWIRSRAR